MGFWYQMTTEQEKRATNAAVMDSFDPEGPDERRLARGLFE